MIRAKIVFGSAVMNECSFQLSRTGGFGWVLISSSRTRPSGVATLLKVGLHSPFQARFLGRLPKSHVEHRN